jgi:hypothetical protein
MVAKKPTKQNPRKSTKAGRRPRFKARRKSPKTGFVVTHSGQMLAQSAAEPPRDGLIKVNSVVVRRRQTARAAGGAVLAKAIPAPAPTTSKGAKAGTQKRGSASEFVRQQPIDTPSNEVVEAAKKLGLKVTAGLVRVTRFKMRHGGEAKPTAAGRGTVRRGRPPKAAVAAKQAVRRGRPPAKAPAVAGGLSLAEVRFRKLAVELGTARAKALVVEVEKAVEAYLTS